MGSKKESRCISSRCANGDGDTPALSVSLLIGDASVSCVARDQAVAAPPTSGRAHSSCRRPSSAKLRRGRVGL